MYTSKDTINLLIQRQQDSEPQTRVEEVYQVETGLGILVPWEGCHKGAFNLLGGVNQGRSLLSAGGLEKTQPVALVNTPEKIECSLIIIPQ